jgi:hypothetical protein
MSTDQTSFCRWTTQVEQSHVEKQLLLKLNEKLGDQTKYGNILIFSATVAAIISGLKDLIEDLVSQMKRLEGSSLPAHLFNGGGRLLASMISYKIP